MSMRILITGADGQLGLALRHAARGTLGMEWHFQGRQELDVTDPERVEQVLRFLRPDAVINTAAYTAVDQAESEPERAHQLNCTAVRQLATVSRSIGARFIHLSTDYVYDNGQTTPYREEDAVQPQSIYAATKQAGERAALEANPTAVIIRTSWLYGPVRHNFLQTILRLARERDRIQVVFDQVGTPTYSGDLAHALVHILDQVRREPGMAPALTGVFNYSNEGVCSWYDFAVAIMRIRGLSCQVEPIRSKAFPTPARRPSYSVMDKTRIRQSFGLRIPHWRDALERCLQEEPWLTNR